MQIRAAQAHGIDPHLHFARLGFFDLLLRQAKFARRRQFSYQH
jgi:hypothetical protein